MESLINTIEIRTINIRINSQPVALRIRSSLSPQEGVKANRSRCLAILTLVTRNWDFQEARESITYEMVTSPKTGKVWLDRNLGATQVATKVDDSAAYGDYYPKPALLGPTTK
jgi:hypothetical protein